jgi:hypothetical protein
MGSTKRDPDFGKESSERFSGWPILAAAGQLCLAVARSLPRLGLALVRSPAWEARAPRGPTARAQWAVGLRSRITPSCDVLRSGEKFLLHRCSASAGEARALALPSRQLCGLDGGRSREPGSGLSLCGVDLFLRQREIGELAGQG